MSESTRPFPRLSDYPWRAGPSYALADVDLLGADDVDDLVPRDSELRQRWAQHLAFDATIYGLPAVWQYVQLHAQALNPDSGRYVGFNRFVHDRELAGPDYAPFLTPNADTLYSNAWLDLRAGPVELRLPPTGDRYLTAQLLDAHSNATNLGTRTVGATGGRFLLHTPHQDTPTPRDDDAPTPVAVATPWMWVLLRVQVHGLDDLDEARRIQEQVTLGPTAPAADPPADAPMAPASPEAIDAFTFLQALDYILRVNGHPVQEDALVRRFRGLGVAARRPLRISDWDEDLRIGVEAGVGEAMACIGGVRTQRGTRTPTGWATLRSGAYGFNYLHRSATNFVGLGGMVREENAAYTTFTDAEGEELDGRAGPYRLLLSPPPVDAFWSLSAYDRDTRRLVDNPLQRYSIGSHRGSLRFTDDRNVELHLSRDGPDDGSTDGWLPVPDSPFYLVLRAYLGHDEVVSGAWSPAAVIRLR